MLTLPNYEIQTQIYESANSQVYRGIRNKDNQPVILKILKENYPTPEELTHYRQEYDLIRQLSHLEGVIKAYRFEKNQNTPVICLEDFGGESLKIWQDAQHTFTLDELLTLAIRITSILGQIHEHNIIHKDINPSNIVLNSTSGVLKIIDFGIATQLSKQHLRLKNPERLEGTLAYISPEQTGRMNRALDYRTDFYSLGATFYELFTGKLPFHSHDAMEIVHSLMAKEPAPPHHVKPDLPLPLSNIILKLLEKTAEARYQSAWGIKADLQECQRQLVKTAQINDFTLAQKDVSDRFHLSQKLYGREAEIGTLVSAFDEAASGKSMMMLVTGYSGIGKSLLIKEFYRSLAQKRGYFISGKFDPFQRHKPYSAIVNAFKELVQQLLTENTAQLAVWKEKLNTAFGPNGQVILEVLPELESIIGKQAPIPYSGPIHSQNRFNIVFQNMMQVFCQPAHPLVLFLDDLQWSDLASLNLLKFITTNRENPAFFLIGAYRDNEVDSKHPLITTLNQIRKKPVIIKEINLKPLTFEQINQLIAESLQKNVKQVRALSDLVMRKTDGNPFFVNQFLHTLFEEQLLYFVPPTPDNKGDWQWNIEQINTLQITDNVVDLMIANLNRLPESAQYVLRLAACIGHQFDLKILSVIYQKSLYDTFQDLMPILKEELILPISEFEMTRIEEEDDDDNDAYFRFIIQSFQFLHDRVQQTAYQLIEDEQKQVVHLQIGRLLLKKTSESALDEKVFDIVDHFDHSLELISDELERLEIAKLNLKAGQKAKMKTAYSAALKYFTTGRACLSENCWENAYDLTLNLFTEGVEVAYLNGRFKEMAELAQVVLQHSQCLSDEIKICEIQIQAHAAQNQQHQAIEIALAFLKRLGIHLPERIRQDEIQLAVQNMQLALSDKSIQSLTELPIMTDPNTILAMRVIVAVIPSAYSLLPRQAILLILKQVELSLKYGNLPESSFAYTSYGFILCGVVSDIESGYQFGLLSLKLLKRLSESRLKARTLFLFNVFVRFWKKPLKKTLLPFLKSYQIALERGNIEYAAYSILYYLSYSYFSGQPLIPLEQDMKRYTKTMSWIKQKNITNRNHLFWQVVLNLMGESSHPCCLIGEVYDEQIELPVHEQANDRTAIHFLYLNKCILHYLFQEYMPALENANQAERHLEAVASLFVVPVFHFYDSLIRLALYPDLSKREQEAVLTKVSANQNKMKQWADHAPMNYLHKFYLVEAERSRILGQDGEAREYYDQAITLAYEHEYLNEEALAYELAGQFYQAKKHSKFAQLCLYEAYYRYKKWGALAKVEELENKYPQWLLSKTPLPQISMTHIERQNTTTILNTGRAKWLDLNSFMKAAQILSSEMRLNHLLEKMMQLVIENAGAQKGILLLPKGDKWFIEAKGDIENNQVAVLESIPIETSEALSAKMVESVARSQECLILHDATQEGLFTNEPYVVTQRPKSVLCLPLLNQGQLDGILYLENNLMTGAFIPERISVLNLLSAQLAISIENATLYTNMSELNKAYERFVPREFLSLLDKQSIIDVQLGDQVEKEMTILFSDIRDFTSLSEKMSPQDNFDFINAYLGQMEPIIHEYHGIIDKYIGDAIMALFPNQVDDAVKGAIAMLKALVKYNHILQHAEFEKIRIGIGLHTGNLMLGTIGGQNRMDGTVISDAVNLASRIEGMTKRYGAALLISENTYAHLNEVSKYAIRTIDRVKVKGKSEPVTVYEVFDADLPVRRELKMKTRDDFEKGLVHYRQKAFIEAIRCFQEVLSRHPDDKAAQIYLGRCQHWQKVGVHENWEGVEALDSK
jgi:predicted ATPase/class 3 adenylate cyclase/tRNA A-37 threonylcarbamoyl transferase component Bud32